jgi:hypothetical protein
MMNTNGKTTVEEAADKVNDVVEDLTLKAADAAIERDSERATNMQGHLCETPVSTSLPDHIDPSSAERAARELQSTSSKSSQRLLVRTRSEI